MIPSVLVLAGPTASGKTALSISLAKEFPIEIVSTDSLQLFRYLDIGTAKPTASDRTIVPHYMIDTLNPDQSSSAAWFAREALASIRDICARKKIPLMIGGNGFYLRALERPPQSDVNETLPLQIPLDEAYAEWEKRDPEGAHRIHPNDRYRIARAHSLLSQGILPSSLQRASAEQPPQLRMVWVGLACEREALYERIDLRLEHMFSDGLLKETEDVLAQFPNAKPKLKRAIGYRQAIDILEGNQTQSQGIQQAKEKSHQYAKRQMTWFRAEKRIPWLSENEVLSRFGYYVEQLT